MPAGQPGDFVGRDGAAGSMAAAGSAGGVLSGGGADEVGSESLLAACLDKCLVLSSVTAPCMHGRSLRCAPDSNARPSPCPPLCL
jgi:hypothetical protein